MSRIPKRFSYCSSRRRVVQQAEACAQILVAMSVKETTDFLVGMALKERIDLFAYIRQWVVARGERIPAELDTDATRARFFTQLMLSAPVAATRDLLMSVVTAENIDMLHHLGLWQATKVSRLEAEGGAVAGAEAAKALHIQSVRAKELLLMLNLKSEEGEG